MTVYWEVNTGSQAEVSVAKRAREYGFIVGPLEKGVEAVVGDSRKGEITAEQAL